MSAVELSHEFFPPGHERLGYQSIAHDSKMCGQAAFILPPFMAAWAGHQMGLKFRGGELPGAGTFHQFHG
jgi:hypothetical protein